MRRRARACRGAVGLLAAILVFELMFASVALELWAQGAYLRMHRTVLDKHPDAEEKLKASRIGRIIAKRRG